jgi:hypothetical protein
MIRKKLIALASVMALSFAPSLAMAQEETAGEGGISTPFGTVAPVVAGAIAIGAIIGLAVVLSSTNNNASSTTTTGPSGTQ